MEMSMATYRDLYNYIETVERDEYGWVIPFEDGWLALHVYDNRQQVHVIRKSDGVSLLALLFNASEGTVKIVPTNENVARYENAIAIPMDIEISKVELPEYTVHQFILSVAELYIDSNSRICVNYIEFQSRINRGEVMRFTIGKKLYKMKRTSESQIKIIQFNGSFKNPCKVTEVKNLEMAFFAILTDYDSFKF